MRGPCANCSQACNEGQARPTPIPDRQVHEVSIGRRAEPFERWRQHLHSRHCTSSTSPASVCSFVELGMQPMLPCARLVALRFKIHKKAASGIVCKFLLRSFACPVSAARLVIDRGRNGGRYYVELRYRMPVHGVIVEAIAVLGRCHVLPIRLGTWH